MQFSSSKENESNDDDDEDESSSTFFDKLEKPIEAVKNTVESLHNKVFSTTTTTNEDEDDEDSRVDSDNDEDSDRETGASWIDRTKQASDKLVPPVLEKVRDRISQLHAQHSGQI